ncbi:MAG: hypothetical protein AB8G96_15040 [Phycisphaerales bacterium]
MNATPRPTNCTPHRRGADVADVARGRSTPGRFGWHSACSAIAPAVLAAVLAGPAAAQQPAVIIAPAQPIGGSVVISAEMLEAMSEAEAAMDAGQAAMPGAGGPDMAGPGGASGLAPEEVAPLTALYNALEPDEQAAMVAEYDAVGIDLLADLGLKELDEAEEAGAMPLLPLVQQRDFKRTPASVLAARSALGLGRPERPAVDADSAALAEWLHTQVMAGEWGELAWFLEARGGGDAEAIYAHILQSTNQGDPLLLPEEVLALSDAAPISPADWQLDVLAQLLKTAGKTSINGPMLARLQAGTRHFGPEGDERRARTADLLITADLPIEAYAYLPPLDPAREAGDASVLLGHAEYHLGQSRAGRGADAEQDARRAFNLFGEVALLDAAEDDERVAGLTSAMKMLPDMPESIATPWLDAVFQRPALAPAALEAIALDALTLADRKLDEQQRARTILIMKSSVDTLLSNPDVDRRALRIPLRMLTTALVTEAEELVAYRPDPRRGDMMVREKAILMRATPGVEWLDTVESSLAVRAWRAFIGLAAVSDETDLALERLELAVARHPNQAAALADEFLVRWTGRLRPGADSDRNAAMASAFFMFGGNTSVPDAPLTRGRQARNLGRLDRVLDIVRGIGVDPRGLSNVVGAFRACHSRAEAFTGPDIERVLGPIDALPAPTAASLADAMRGGLGGDWRNRQTQQRFGLRRNATEIGEIVAEGYEVAMQLIDRAIEESPEDWGYSVTRAALAFDRLEHRRAQQGEDFDEYETLRRQSFDAFRDAADRYTVAVADGGLPPSIDVHLAWFNAAVGATQLNQLNRDNILYEGSERDTQIDSIRAALITMPPALAEEHIGLFTQRMVDGLAQVNPEVKPRLVRHAMRVVGNHPLGAPLRRIQAVHDDLISNEIALRMTLDGPDRVGDGRPFGAVLAIRYTNAVDRETDGFSKYLRNQVWSYFGNQGRTVNYRDRLEESIQRSLEENFDVESVAFFDPLFPSREVRERGESGWQEKPMAYIVLSARDASIERIPPVQMDLDFLDSTGPVILAVESNAPIIDAADAPANRPVRELMVRQTLDTRAMNDADSGRAITLEIRATGRGIVPELDELLVGVQDAMPGYVIPDDGIETYAVNLLSTADAVEDPFGFMGGGDEPEEDAIMGPDEDGVFRTALERSWMIRFVPGEGSTGDTFRLPALAEGIDGTLESRTFDDLDVVTVSGRNVALDGVGVSPLLVVGLMIGGLAIVAGVLMAIRRGGRAASADTAGTLLPSRATPLAAIAALQRIDREHGERIGETRRGELASEIRDLERRYFGPEAQGSDTVDAETTGTVERWAAAVRA